jgi:hypothetical protein
MKNQYEVAGDSVAIYINGHPDRTFTVIDLEDLEKANSYTGTWHANKHAGGKYYIVGDQGKGNPKARLHRLLTDAPKGKLVDHLDGDTLNNRRKSNLRVVGHEENNQNTKGHSDRKNKLPKNVYKDRRSDKDKYKVTIYSGGKQNYFGTYDTIEEAKKVAEEKRKQLQPYVG